MFDRRYVIFMQYASRGFVVCRMGMKKMQVIKYVAFEICGFLNSFGQILLCIPGLCGQAGAQVQQVAGFFLQYARYENMQVMKMLYAGFFAMLKQVMWFGNGYFGQFCSDVLVSPLTMQVHTSFLKGFSNSRCFVFSWLRF